MKRFQELDNLSMLLRTFVPGVTLRGANLTEPKVATRAYHHWDADWTAPIAAITRASGAMPLWCIWVPRSPRDKRVPLLALEVKCLL